MDNTNNEAINMNQGDLPSPDMRTLSDMANKMGQRSDDRGPQNQAEETLKAHFNQANEDIEQERNERFSQLGNKTLRTIAEQSVMSDIDREDARNELKRREGEEYKEPESKNTISKDDFEAFRKDLGENLYGTEKNSDGKIEIWTPTKAQREYLEAKKSGHGDKSYPLGEVKTTMTEFENNKTNQDNVVEEYLWGTLDGYKRIKRYSEDEKKAAFTIYNDRRQSVSRNPLFYNAIVQKAFSEALRNDKMENTSPQYLEATTRECVKNAMKSKTITGYDNWQREKDLVRNAIISSDRTDAVINYDIERTIKKNKGIFDIPKKTKNEITRDEFWHGRLLPQTLIEKPEEYKHFLAEHEINPEEKQNKLIAIRSVWEMKEALSTDPTEEQSKELNKRISNLDQIFGLSDFVYDEANRIMTKSKNGQFLLYKDGLQGRTNWTPYIGGSASGVRRVPIELCGRLISECEKIEQKVSQRINEMMQVGSVKESDIRYTLLRNPSEDFEAFDDDYDYYGANTRKAWQKKLQALNLVYNSATAAVKFKDIEHELADSPLTDEEKKFYWNIGRGKIRDIEVSRINIDKKDFEAEFSEGVKDVIATGTVDYYEYNGYGSQKQSDFLVEEMLTMNPDILDDLDLSSIEMYKLGIEGWLNTIQSVNGDKNKQADWYFENIIKYHGDIFVGEDYPKIREDLTRAGATGVLRKINAFLKNNERYQKWLNENREGESATEDNSMIDISEAFHLELSNRVRARIKGEAIEEIEGYSEKSVFNSGPEHEPRKYKETMVPANYGDYKIESILNLYDYFKNNYPESNARLKIHRFGEPKEQEEIQSNILDGKYPPESYFGFTFNYDGEPCGIFDNIGNDSGSGRVAVHGERGDDPCDLLFRDSRMGALYRGQADNKTIRFNHKDPEHIDESLRKLDLRTLHWLKNGKRLNSNTGYDTNVDIDNRDRFYSARATISNIEARLESDEDLDQQTMDELNETLNNARKILDKAQEEKQKAYDNLFI